ncbi:10820_t:CDS:2 [Cetraspora pellucida]|uniref:10820_t:CDS:1 n=1 Tax=Cetraspora pellucida TaxID=1433469 RepID=A0A9N9FVK0_9GLOM|nr:10820_t:CDS:2 [Cetraspora pellucida]
MVLILSGNKLALKGEITFPQCISDQVYFIDSIRCHELCCNKNSLKEELAKAGA